MPRHRLFMKSNMYGITGKAHRWIEDIIGNRTQEVVVNGSKSERRMVKSGVPQGTVLGPLIFLTYINDIESQITSSIRHFADDCTLYIPKYLKVTPFLTRRYIPVAEVGKYMANGI